MILLNEAAQREGIPLPDLVPSAQQIRQAVESLVLAGQKLVSETQDNVCLCKYTVVKKGRVLLRSTLFGWLGWPGFFVFCGKKSFSVGLVDQLFQLAQSLVEMVEDNGQHPLTC